MGGVRGHGRGEHGGPGGGGGRLTPPQTSPVVILTDRFIGDVRTLTVVGSSAGPRRSHHAPRPLCIDTTVLSTTRGDGPGRRGVRPHRSRHTHAPRHSAAENNTQSAHGPTYAISRCARCRRITSKTARTTVAGTHDAGVRRGRAHIGSDGMHMQRGGVVPSSLAQSPQSRRRRSF